MTHTTIGENELREVYVADADVTISTTQEDAAADLEGLLSQGWDLHTEAHLMLAIAALRRSAGLGTVSVKPLEWINDADDLNLVSYTPVGRYAISEYHGMITPFRLYTPTAPERSPHRTLDEAKAAAQSDFETRVKSCLTSIGVAAGE